MKSSFKVSVVIFCSIFVILSPSVAMGAVQKPVVERRDLLDMPTTWIDLTQVTNSDSRTKLLLVSTRVSNGRAAALFARVSFAGSDVVKKDLDIAFDSFASKHNNILVKSKQEIDDTDQESVMTSNPNFVSDYYNFLSNTLQKDSLSEIIKAGGVSFAVAIWPLERPQDIKIIEIAPADQLDPILVKEYISLRYQSDISSWLSLPIEWSFGPSYLVWSIKKTYNSGSEKSAQTAELYRHKLSNGVTEKIWSSDVPLVSATGNEWNDLTEITSDYNSILVMGIQRNEGGGYVGNLFRWSESDFKFLPVEAGFKPLKKSYYFDATQTQVIEGSHYIFLPVTYKGKYDHTEVIDKTTGKQFVVRVPGVKEITKQYCTIYAEQLVCREVWTGKAKPATQYVTYDMKTKKANKFTVPLVTNISFIARENLDLFVTYYSSNLNTNTLGVFDTRTKKLYEMNTPSLYTSDILGLEGMDFVDYSLGHIVLSSQLSANKISTSSDLPNTATFGAVIKHSHYEKEFQDFERMFANNPVFATYKLNK